MRAGQRRQIEELLSRKFARADFLPGGCVGEVWRVTFEDGFQAVAKTADGDGSLEREAYMLGFLSDHSALPLPKLYHAEASLLLLEAMPNDGRFTPSVDEDAARLLGQLHQVKGNAFGLERDTMIGSLLQPNGWAENWIDFFIEKRLLHFGRDAYDAGQLPLGCMDRIEALAAKLPALINPVEEASLIHGDVWGGNVLAYEGAISSFIDPACYYADSEIELAYIAMFRTFDQPFFDRYREEYGLSAGFSEVKCPIYTLYPLLVHARLFGGNYGADADDILRKFVT